jgi:hypothetical protein
MAVRRIKLSTKIKTMNDILARSDVNDVIEGIVNDKKDITDILIICKLSDNTIHYVYTMNESDIQNSDIQNSELKTLGLMEYTKNSILNPSEAD